MPPGRGCRLAMTDEALLDNAQFVIIGPISAAITIGSGKNFDLRAVDKVGHKVGLTIGANPRSDGRPRRLTFNIVLWAWTDNKGSLEVVDDEERLSRM